MGVIATALFPLDRFCPQHVWWRGPVQYRSSGWCWPVQSTETSRSSETTADLRSAFTVRHC